MNLGELLDELRVGVLGDVFGRVGVTNPASLSLADLIDETRVHLLKDVTGRVSLSPAAPMTLGAIVDEVRVHVLKDVTGRVTIGTPVKLTLAQLIDEARAHLLKDVTGRVAFNTPVKMTLTQLIDEVRVHVLKDVTGRNTISSQPMTLASLLTELRQNALRDVTDAIGPDPDDLLFSDAALTGYLNEGYMRLIGLLTPYGDETLDPSTIPAMVLGTDAPSFLNPGYHMMLVDWAAYRALRNHDTDLETGSGQEGSMQAKAAGHKAAFDEAVAALQAVHNNAKLTRYINEGYQQFIQKVIPYGDETLDPASVSPLSAGSDTPDHLSPAFHMSLADWASWRVLQALGVETAQVYQQRFIEALTDARRVHNNAKLTRYINEAYQRLVSATLPYGDESLAANTVAPLLLGTDTPDHINPSYHMVLADWAAYRVMVDLGDEGAAAEQHKARYDEALTLMQTVHNNAKLTRYINEGYQRLAAQVVPYGTNDLTAKVVSSLVLDTDTPVALHPGYHMMLADWASWRVLQSLGVDAASFYKGRFDQAEAEVKLFYNNAAIVRYLNEGYQRVISATLPHGAATTSKATVSPLAADGDVPSYMNPAYHMALADWAAYRILSSETSSERAAEHRRNFDTAVATMRMEANDGHLTRYINEAYGRVMARLMPRRVDSPDTTEGVTVFVAPGFSTADLPPGVTNVRGAFVVDEDGNRRKLEHVQVVPEGEGSPRAFSTAANAGKITVGPVSQDLVQLSLSVVGPVRHTLLTAADSPQFDEAFHMMLVDWAAFRAVRAMVSNRRDLTPDQQNMLIAQSNGYRNAYEASLRELVYNEKTRVGWPVRFKSDFYGGCGNGNSN